MPSQRQIAANRRNARSSRGPITPEGRAAVRFNALKHGLAAHHAVFSQEEEEPFRELLETLRDEYQPVGPTENLLVDQLAMAAWRLRRLRALEAGLFNIRIAETRRAIREKHASAGPREVHAYAFLQDARGVNAFSLLGRYEARFERAFHRALQALQQLKAASPPQDQPPAPPAEAAPPPESERLAGQAPTAPPQATPAEETTPAASTCPFARPHGPNDFAEQSQFRTTHSESEASEHPSEKSGPPEPGPALCGMGPA